jgi:hypothetical protein
MPEPHNVEVELSALLQRLKPVQLKGLVSAPLGYKASKLAKLASDQEPVLGIVKPDELVSVLLHRAALDDKRLGKAVIAYREARAWQLRRSLGEQTDEQGSWFVEVPGRGQRYG